MKLQTGDVIVGINDPSKSVYSAHGKKIIAEGVSLVGSAEDITRLQSKIKHMAEQTGKQLDENKKLKKRTTKNVKAESKYFQPHYEIETPETILPQINQILSSVYIYFENSFGRIRCSVENVTEHAQAFMLVFSNEDDIVFEPKTGETLEFTWNRDKYTVYYPGVIFDWTDGVKKIMILFKAPQENE